jgi:hypothetical protein
LLIERWRSRWAPMVRVWAAYLQASFTSEVIVIAIRSYHNTGFATSSTEASRRNAGSDRGANEAGHNCSKWWIGDLRARRENRFADLFHEMPEKCRRECRQNITTNSLPTA